MEVLVLKLLVIDGNSIVNRAFYGIKLLTTKSGRYTNAIVGFMNILSKLEQDEKPDEVAVAFDLKAPTFRHKMYDGYKAQRKGMPEELAAQMPVLKELLGFLGYKMVTCEGFEADDILGTLAAACEKRGDKCLLATGDRDSLQLVCDDVTVLLASTGETKVMDTAAVREKYGIEPKQLIEVKSLMGDTSDNIPGVAGVGEKTALALIQSFGTLGGVYENIDDASIKKGVREKLLRDKEQAEMSRVLAEIRLDAPVETENGAYVKAAPDTENAAKLLTELEMYATLKKLALSPADAKAAADAPELVSKDIAPLTNLSGKVYIFASENNILVVQNDKVYTANIGSEESLALLCDESAEKYAFDAKIFYKAAFAAGREAKNIVFDAKLAAYLLNPSASEYGIERLAAEYGVAAEFDCGNVDAALIEPLCGALRKQLDEEQMSKLHDEIELPLCEVLAEMEHVGILVDKGGIEQFGKELDEVIAAELKIIYEAVGYEFNVNSPKQLGKALFEDLQLPTRKKTKTGYSTNAETLESLRHESPVIEHILAYRTYQKLNSTYVAGLLKVIAPDGRMHSTFNQTETRTGRISSSEPNLQNIPVRTELGSRFRKYFIAAEGKTLLDADYSQIELRILAHISGDKAMQDAFINGADIHRSTAAKVYGIADEDVTPRQRSSAKAVNFGIVYGIGAFSLAKDIGVTVREADEFIKTYLAKYPDVDNYMKDAISTARERGFAVTMFGRRRALPELDNSNFNIRALGERMAMNTPIQGTAADIIKLAMVRVYRRFKAEKLSARLILQVHDELIVEAPESEKELASKILGEEMRGAVTLAVPLPADVNCGETWYEAKG